jgi:hypothetical protein
MSELVERLARQSVKVSMVSDDEFDLFVGGVFVLRRHNLADAGMTSQANAITLGLKAVVRSAFDEAVRAVRAEAVDGTVSTEDAAYNRALEDAVGAIEALKGGQA